MYCIWIRKTKGRLNWNVRIGLEKKDTKDGIFGRILTKKKLKVKTFKKFKKNVGGHIEVIFRYMKKS